MQPNEGCMGHPRERCPGHPPCANCMVHSGYEASAVNDTFNSWRGFVATVKASFSTVYKDDEAAEMLKEPVRPVHAHNPLVEIGNPTLSPDEGERKGHPSLEETRA